MLTRLWSRLRNRWSMRQGWPLITPPTVPPAGSPKFSDRARSEDQADNLGVVRHRWNMRQGWPLITPPTVPPAGPPKFSDRARPDDQADNLGVVRRRSDDAGGTV